MKSDFIGMLFHIRDFLHLKHLETTSYAAHVVLEGAYTSLLPLIDKLAEGIVGVEGYGNIIIPQTTSGADLQEFIEKTYQLFKASRSQFSENWQLAILDQLEEIFAILSYKIKYLR